MSMVANIEMERIWKEATVVHLKALYQLLFANAEKCHNKLQYYPVSGPEFEPATSQLRSSGATCYKNIG
jgi:hypothetical protein